MLIPADQWKIKGGPIVFRKTGTVEEGETQMICFTILKKKHKK